jgi:HD-GYP domain-containing protein (c-di-GMP phosphodiesterase class II)
MSTQAAPQPGLGEKVLLVTQDEGLEQLRQWLPGSRAVKEVSILDLKPPTVIISDTPAVFSTELREAVLEEQARLVYVLEGDGTLPAESTGFPIYFFLIRPFHQGVLESTVRGALENLRLASKNRELTESLKRAHDEIDDLNSIGIALSAERDVQPLLELILGKSREITGSDAGSLYLVEENQATGEKVLRFTLTQNESVQVPFNQFTIPIDTSRIAPYVALKGETLALIDAYYLPPGVPYGFSRDFDAQIGYRTKSMLTVPMKNPEGEVVGVLQLLNCKRDPQAKVTPENADLLVIPYPGRVQQLVESLASQAAVALGNARLYESIQNLFEGMVKASVVAIEARDPTTFGHSFRVEKVTSALAEAVDGVDDGLYRDVKFTPDQMRELRYAALLHDFGKVGVREEVLVKAKKLYPAQLEIVRERFNFVRKSIREEHAGHRLQYLLEKGREEYLKRLPEFDAELAERLKEMDGFFEFLLQCNEPTVLPEGNFERLADLAARRFLDDWAGEERALLQPGEMRLLSIPKGSLDAAEREEIQSHVDHTFNFLSTIPWTKEIRNIPMIARAHHEKLNGSGYPRKITAADIPIQSKMMTISDIYDALSASDRPYKKAVPVEKALKIIGSEVQDKMLDEELFRIFREKELWRLTVK